MDGQVTKRHRKIAESYNYLSRVHERYRRQTDGRATANSECEREFTFAKNHVQTARNFSANVTCDHGSVLL